MVSKQCVRPFVKPFTFCKTLNMKDFSDIWHVWHNNWRLSTGLVFDLPHYALETSTISSGTKSLAVVWQRFTVGSNSSRIHIIELATNLWTYFLVVVTVTDDYPWRARTYKADFRSTRRSTIILIRISFTLSNSLGLEDARK